MGPWRRVRMQARIHDFNMDVGVEYTEIDIEYTFFKSYFCADKKKKIPQEFVLIFALPPPRGSEPIYTHKRRDKYETAYLQDTRCPCGNDRYSCRIIKRPI